jgi:hypothetical protein
MMVGCTSVSLHLARSDFKQFFEIIAKKHTQRVSQLIALARKDLTAEDFIAQVLDKGEVLRDGQVVYRSTTIFPSVGCC